MKRKIASLLSLAMILSSMSVDTFADTGALPDNTNANFNNVSGDAGLNAIDTTVLRVVLPTSGALSYIADPQGLAQLDKDSSQEASELTGGYVYSKDDVSIANRSSVDVIVTANVTATTVTSPGSGKTAATVFKSTDNLETSTAPIVQLGVVVSEPTYEIKDSASANTISDNDPQLASGDDGYTAYYEIKTSTKSVDKKKAYLLSSTDGSAGTVKIPVKLGKAEYVAKSTTTNEGDKFSYSVKSDSVGDAVTFSMTGKCSANGWNDKVVAPSISTTYQFTKVPANDSTTWGASEYGLLVNEDTDITKGTGGGEQDGYYTAPVIISRVDALNIVTDKMTFKIGANETEQKALAAAFNDATEKAKFTVKKAGGTGDLGDAISSTEADAEGGTFTITGTFTPETEYKVVVEYNGKKYIGKAKAAYAAGTGATIAADTNGAVVTVGADVELASAADIRLKEVKVAGTEIDDATVASVDGATFTLGSITLTSDDVGKSISVEFVYNNKAYTAIGTVSRVYEAEALESGKVTATKETITADLGEDVESVASVSVKIGDDAAVTIAQAGYELEDGILTITADDAGLEIPAATAVVVTVTSDATGKKYTGSATTPTDLTSAVLVSATQLNIVVPGVTHVANKVTALSVGGDSITFTPALNKDGTQIKLTIASGAVSADDAILVTYDGTLYAATVTAS